ncbi:Dirigent protein 9 [Linum grandiflorum]
MFIFFIFITTIISQSSSARTIANPVPPPGNHHKNLTFLMQNVLNVTKHRSPNEATKQLTTQIPFPKPLGIFPPSKGILIPQQPSNLPNPATIFTKQTLDDSAVGLLSTPAGRATLEELEVGSVAEISEELFENSSYGPVVVGRAQGLFVAASSDEDDGTNTHMVAITANLFINGDDHKVVRGDGLRLFGVHTSNKKKVKGESHIAVIGGTGKYEGANGFAVIKPVDLGSNFALVQDYTTRDFLLFTVYLG